MVFETPADRLRKRRMELGYSDAAEAARARGWNVRTYQAHESGKKEIGKKSLITYAASYGLTMDFLLSGKRQKNTKPDNSHQPPLAFRRIPLLTSAITAKFRDKKSMLALELPEFVLVNVSSKLGPNSRAFVAQDDAMMTLDPQDKRNIRRGDDVVFDSDRDYEPGDLIAAVIHNPTRYVARTYGLLRDPSGKLIVKLSPASKHHPEEMIASEEDGFILGRVVRIQSGRDL